MWLSSKGDGCVRGGGRVCFQNEGYLLKGVLEGALEEDGVRAAEPLLVLQLVQTHRGRPVLLLCTHT